MCERPGRRLACRAAEQPAFNGRWRPGAKEAQGGHPSSVLVWRNGLVDAQSYPFWHASCGG
jgi:hypothetical protein